jgi:aminopeptidase N
MYWRSLRPIDHLMRTCLRLFALSLVFIAGARPLTAQSNAERMANDHYSRSHDYDLVHQRIEVWNFDWDRFGFEGRTTVHLRALRPGLDTVRLDAGKLLEVTGIHAQRGDARLAFLHSGDTLAVCLPRPLAMGDSAVFVIDYRGRVANGTGLTFIDADTLPPARPRQLWSQGENDNNHHWFPTYDFPNDKMTWEVIATVPKGFTAVSNGRLVADRTNRDGTRTMRWSQERASTTYLVSLIVAPLVRFKDRWRSVPVDYYVYRQDSARARPLFRVTPDMIDVYSRLTGVDYPWAKYAQTTVADFFGGMENVSATTLVDWLPDSRAYADRPWYQRILIPHELAHQWFGDYVTTANWANMFMPGRYWAAKLGRAAAEDYYLDEYGQFMAIDRDRRMPLAALGSNNIYPKGALVLEMLRKYLGDDRFWAGVRRYLKDHAYDVATTDDLRQAFLLATGENLDWFWDQWIYQAGYPEFNVSAAWDSAQSTVSFTVRQEQRDTLKPDSTGLRFTVPEVFRIPVIVRVRTARGDISRRVTIDQREQTIEVPGVGSAPTMVIFDDGNTILKRLTFEQPTTWLAAQLAQDPDLWNRAWVIEQLGERKSDPEALAALLRAATASDYLLTRAQAVEALGGFAGDGVPAALITALGDTSAQVRAAAASALAGSPSDTVRAAVRRAWERDSSYAVKAAALGALARLDSLNAKTLLREGLRAPSYQNAIQDAALFAIMQAADTNLLDDVAGAVETGSNATFVLAAFAARGNGRALQALEGNVYSPRRLVRQRALQAFQSSLPPALARPRLAALMERAPSEAIRRELASTLDRIGPDR